MAEDDPQQEPTPAKTQLIQPAKGAPVEIPLPKRADWEKVLGRATRPNSTEADEQRG
jgi:hypothetical protein